LYCLLNNKNKIRREKKKGRDGGGREKRGIDFEREQEVMQEVTRYHS